MRATLALLAILATGAVCEERQDTPAAVKARETEPKAATVPPGDDGPEQTAHAGVRPAEAPPDPSLEEARGPDVTLIAGEDRTVYEYRQNGKLRMIKVVPQGGRPYFLVPRDPTAGFGDLEQADTLVPRWVLLEF